MLLHWEQVRLLRPPRQPEHSVRLRKHFSHFSMSVSFRELSGVARHNPITRTAEFGTSVSNPVDTG